MGDLLGLHWSDKGGAAVFYREVWRDWKRGTGEDNGGLHTRGPNALATYGYDGVDPLVIEPPAGAHVTLKRAYLGSTDFDNLPVTIAGFRDGVETARVDLDADIIGRTVKFGRTFHDVDRLEFSPHGPVEGGGNLAGYLLLDAMVFTSHDMPW